MTRYTQVLAGAVMLLTGGLPPSGEETVRASANDNRRPAGAMHGDTLILRLVVQAAEWYPEAEDGPHSTIQAFAEEGQAPSIPAPLIRAETGRPIRATIRNALTDSTIHLIGLSTQPIATADTLHIQPGKTAEVMFRAGAPGTYLYRAVIGNDPDGRPSERETAVGAFVVDPEGGSPPDRIFVVNVIALESGPVFRQAIGFNGKSWPYTERVPLTVGDTVHWRIVNGTTRGHPMHLHGFYFTIASRGMVKRDTAYDAVRQRSVVTEVMEPFSTMAMSWVPDREGRWLFHCHIAFHATSITARLDPPPDEHATMSDDPGEHMAGLVLGLEVKPAAGWTPEPRPTPRTLRMFVREGSKLGRAERSMGYAIEHGSESPTSPLTRVGGPPLVLTRGQPTDITVINTLNEPTAVHWHGLELESYSDGVSGWSGRAGNPAPRIAPADSFVARLTSPRAGTFIYHTHLHDEVQLTSGLYGAIIVMEPREAFDPSSDHVYVVGWDGETNPRFLVNGDSVLPPMTWRFGRKHRLRLVNIGPAEAVRMMVRQDTTTSVWQPVAKDGAHLPAHQSVARPATVVIDVGETADFTFTPPRRGEYVLSIQLLVAKEPITQRIVVR